MAFWGVEVKPGKPFTHRFDNSRGRLHISQATLGIGSSTNKSLVQCNVGDKSPILLCSLLPDKTESCPLDLEFEEDDEVIFSVLGPRSAHLTGYYIGNGPSNGDGDDTDSYGEDIAESDTEQSTNSDAEDEYEDDFIDDGDLEMFPPSPRPNSGVVIEEIIDDEKPANWNGGRKRLKKKYQISDSDGDDELQVVKSTTSVQTIQVVKSTTSVPVLDSEDEDGLPISSLPEIKTTIKKTKVEQGSDKKTANESKVDVTGLKRKIDTFQDSEAERGVEQSNDSSMPSTEAGHENVVKPKKKKKERTKEGKADDEKSDAHNEDTTQSEEAKEDKMGQDQSVGDEPKEKLLNDKGAEQLNESSMPSTEAGHENDERPKKKKKERAKEGKTPGEGDDDKSDAHNEDAILSEAKTDKMDQDQIVGDEPGEKLPNDKGAEEPNESSLPSTEAGLENDGKLKKKKKERAKEGKTHGVGDDDKGDAHNEDTTQSEEAKTDKMDQDQTVGDEPEEKLPNDKSLNIDVDNVADEGQVEAKKKKKKKKKKKSKAQDSDKNANTEEEGNKGSVVEVGDKKAEVKPLQVRNFSNGFVIEELERGKPEGKSASPGSKVSVHYIGKLKKNGQIFDSNVGRAPFKFRLGAGEVIKGWDVGVSGMQVGDKRRITIPPSMGYGSKGAGGGKIPPNAWLEFDVELVGVR